MTDVRAELQRASACLERADAAGCRAVCDALLRRRPNLVQARHLRGLAAAQAGDDTLAIDDLAAVFQAQPDNGHAAFWLGRLLRRADRLDESLAPLEAAARHPELETDARYELARALTRLRRSEEAEKQYRRIVARNPRHADAAANLAFLLERRNRLDEAAERAAEALELDPANFIASLTRAVLERRGGDPEAARRRLERLLRTVEHPMNRSVTLNQLGQCLDRLGEWDLAWDRFRESNEILRQQHPHGRPAETGPYGLATLSAVRDWLARRPVETWTANPLAAEADPVFLVGFPRSGTTLLDQLLSAHPDIEVCEEHELFDGVRRDWIDDGRLESLADMGPDDLRAARSTYLDALARHRRHPDRPVAVDKLPLNLAWLSLVHRLFPRSHVVFALRDPRDACLSCWFQAFDLQGAMPYFLDIADTARYYDAVMSLAADTLAQIGNPTLQLRYEDVVTDLEGRARALVEFLGRGWTDEVLDYRHKAKERVINTPSYQQVVQPLYTSSIGRWRHYRRHLEPVLPVLGPWVERYGYETG